MIALIEPDRGGDALLRRLMQSSHQDRIAAARLPGFKDVSELHIREPERFDEILDAAVQSAAPLSQVHAALAERPRRRRAAAEVDDDGKQRGPRPIDWWDTPKARRRCSRRLLASRTPPSAPPGSRKVWAVRSRGFKDWLLFRYFRGDGPRAQRRGAKPSGRRHRGARQVQRRDGPTVFLGTASLGPKLYLDLCDEAWRAIEIEDRGWRLVAAPPVFFSWPEACLRCRSPSAAALSRS